MPKLSVIVAVHNQLPMNRLFVESLRASTDADHELIVVDNGSTDGSREWFAAQGARVIANDGNYGYPHCQNQGIAAARGEVLAFLNNDLILSRHWDTRLLQAMATHGLDVASPCVAERAEDAAASRRLNRRWKRIKYPLLFLLGAREGSLRLMHRLMYGDWQGFTEARFRRFGLAVVEGFVGAAPVMTRRALELLGPWDPRVTAADFDLFLRTKQRSEEQGDLKPFHVVPGVFVHHYQRLSFTQRYPPFADRERFVTIEQKWHRDTVARYLAGVDV